MNHHHSVSALDIKESLNTLKIQFPTKKPDPCPLISWSMLQDNFEHSFFKLTAELLETEQVQGSRGISETKLRLNLPLPPATALISWVSKDLMWHSSMKDWFIDLVLDWVLTRLPLVYLILWNPRNFWTQELLGNHMISMGKVWADPELPWEELLTEQGVGQSLLKVL